MGVLFFVDGFVLNKFNGGTIWDFTGSMVLRFLGFHFAGSREVGEKIKMLLTAKLMVV
ncbi:hypothetical protein LR48_Vigan01g111900 [Vigna angularis]|uniref:Uncharacterized protein n=1 Tax=Phaseolus angularis TaxID=3914 RepID=A0A0L9TN24_PHAAN|nr:hypothetical protein LR48_Vigan01g111900 [Vigna angularis]